MSNDGSHDESNGNSGGTELSIDATFEILAHRDRRRILNYLVDSSDNVATTGELVDHVVQADTERLGEVPNRDHRHAELYHLHLPKLTEAGVLEYDPRSQQLRYRGDDRLETWLRCVDADD